MGERFVSRSIPVGLDIGDLHQVSARLVLADARELEDDDTGGSGRSVAFQLAYAAPPPFRGHYR